MRGETSANCRHAMTFRFQSTPLMRGETLEARRICAIIAISIHSPHARGDLGLLSRAECKHISIHSPHARGDPVRPSEKQNHKYFNPLPSCEGRRTGKKGYIGGTLNFNPLPSCEGRQIRSQKGMQTIKISIHSPHARGDALPFLVIKCKNNFNPLPSCEGRPVPSAVLCGFHRISIHSPHARGDPADAEPEVIAEISIHSPHARGDGQRLVACSRTSFDFNPLPSCEGRQFADVWRAGDEYFNPLPSCEGRRHISAVSARRTDISIHSPHARGDGGLLSV